MPGVAAIVLAAGASSRMGRPKQLLPIDGVPMLARVVAVARAAGCDPTIVVVGRDAAACRAMLDRERVQMVLNPDWERGMGSSLRAGAAVVPDDVEAAFILLADQPHVTADTLRRLSVAAVESGRPIALAAYADTVGPPVRVAPAYLPRLRDWPVEQGAKGLWLGRPEDVTRVDCAEAAFDLDTPADYESLGRSSGVADFLSEKE